MNRHFRRDNADVWPLPGNVYARLDHVELSDPGNWSVLLAFDAVDAQWLIDRARLDERFDLGDPDRALAAIAARPLQPAPPGHGQGPFEDAPLYRLEIEHRLGQPLFNYGLPDFVDTGRADSGLAALEAAWFALDIAAAPVEGRLQAKVYPSLFAAPTNAYVTGTMPSVQQGRALSGIFSLASLAAVSTAALESKLAGSIADLLAVYDVGQGNELAP